MCVFFNDTATTEIYTLSLHDALPISRLRSKRVRSSTFLDRGRGTGRSPRFAWRTAGDLYCATLGCSERSEEHTSELQSHLNLVSRLLLEKKKQQTTPLAS